MGAADAPFRRFYEDVLVMLGDAPLETVLQKIDMAHPETEAQRTLLGYLRDSLVDLQRSGRETDPRALALEDLIQTLESRFA